MLHKLTRLQEAVADFSEVLHIDLSNADALHSASLPEMTWPSQTTRWPFICKQYMHWSPQYELMLVCAGATLLHKLNRLDEAVSSVASASMQNGLTLCRLKWQCNVQGYLSAQAESLGGGCGGFLRGAAHGSKQCKCPV